jgi:hypothetical protein
MKLIVVLCNFAKASKTEDKKWKRHVHCRLVTLQKTKLSLKQHIKNIQGSGRQELTYPYNPIDTESHEGPEKEDMVNFQKF